MHEFRVVLQRPSGSTVHMTPAINPRQAVDKVMTARPFTDTTPTKVLVDGVDVTSIALKRPIGPADTLRWNALNKKLGA